MKPRLRRHIKQTLAAMHIAHAAEKSHAVCRRLIGQEEFQRAGTVMLFLSVREEVDTSEIAEAAWSAGKKVLVPRVDWDNRHMCAVEIHSLRTGLLTNERGLREPTVGTPWPIGKIELILIPAMAFDRHGNRLGRGGGFYDRFLAMENLQAQTCGLAFDEQLLDEVPVQPNDRPVTMVVTDKEVLRFSPARGSMDEATRPQNQGDTT